MDNKITKQDLAVVATLMENDEPLDPDVREFISRTALKAKALIPDREEDLSEKKEQPDKS